jgi:hypothetical protein
MLSPFLLKTSVVVRHDGLLRVMLVTWQTAHESESLKAGEIFDTDLSINYIRFVMIFSFRIFHVLTEIQP